LYFRNTTEKPLDNSVVIGYTGLMMKKEMIMDLKPMNPADILRMSTAQRANVEFANARVEMFKPDAQKMKELADGMRAVLKAQMESYKNHVIETYLDCEADKIKVSKRVAKVPKYARSVVKGRASKTMGDTFMMGRQKHTARYGV
jgi:hypothetical protein